MPTQRDNNDDQYKSANRKIIKELAPYMQLGTQMAVTIGLFVLLGWWLDGKFETKPVLILICSFLGIAMAMYNFFRIVSQLDKKEKRRKQREKERKDKNI